MDALDARRKLNVHKISEDALNVERPLNVSITFSLCPVFRGEPHLDESLLESKALRVSTEMFAYTNPDEKTLIYQKFI